ncbi:MAG: class I SAM-dependent methyltransferase [Candidatus Roizmanbacteria bacterium]|nr:class I SAM-dependent methyltransferase [Candidatus Roizmanbacteria bacterium]
MSIKAYASHLFRQWAKDDLECVYSYLEPNKNIKLLDLGCAEGTLTKKFADYCNAEEVVGIDGVKSRNLKGINIIQANLNDEFPLPKNHFDVVISHYSFEHLYNPGLFISEIYRVLKKGGYCIIATDNLSCWPNILALIMGWQPFSTTDGVGSNAIGNPFAIHTRRHKGEKAFEKKYLKQGIFEHNKVMAYQMLIDSFTYFHFNIERIKGVGYFPLYGYFAKLMNKIDIRHSHFLIIKARKT